MFNERCNFIMINVLADGGNQQGQSVETLNPKPTLVMHLLISF
jgi:hypothetical protein